MTTITIKQNFPLSQTVFDSVEELMKFLSEQFKSSDKDSEDFVLERDIDFRMLTEDELTPDVLAEAQAASSKPISDYVSIDDL